jgi:hypothetical protein
MLKQSGYISKARMVLKAIKDRIATKFLIKLYSNFDFDVKNKGANNFTMNKTDIIYT